MLRSGTINARRPTAVVRDPVKIPGRFAPGALGVWTPAFAVVRVVAVWVFLATLGVALPAGGRTRGIGMAVILGQALGLVLLAVTVFGPH